MYNLEGAPMALVYNTSKSVPFTYFTCLTSGNFTPDGETETKRLQNNWLINLEFQGSSMQ